MIFDDFCTRRLFDHPANFFVVAQPAFSVNPFFSTRLHLGSASLSALTLISGALQRRRLIAESFSGCQVFLSRPAISFGCRFVSQRKLGSAGRCATRAICSRTRPSLSSIFNSAPLCLFPPVLLFSESGSVQEGRLLCQGPEQVKHLFASSTKKPIIKYKAF